MNTRRSLALLTAFLLASAATSAEADFILPHPPTPTYMLDASTTSNVVGFVHDLLDFSDSNPSARDARKFKRKARRSVVQLMRSFRRTDWHGPLLDELLALLESNNPQEDARSILAKPTPPSLPNTNNPPNGSGPNRHPDWDGGNASLSDSSFVSGDSSAKLGTAPEPGSMTLWATATLAGLTVLRRRSKLKSA
ncbi:hypothetical protein KOR42_37210 [Thalassoglobus neptunius]|uniref:PEP-CTERM protein-sorting domain-containing protein n=1 Tax=Thalassoglobus neptunius TaxID=1938619 RepID=A0A5C5WHK7_9PLAN|nr:hypothetical protein [Thalassoglobus neptunius]TWT50037.1 hypothetical protein KOR42_37210 [Thalassoglobus neptunius]